MNKWILIFLFLLPLSAGAAASPCVNIYFDHANDDYWMGRTYSIFVQNLLGHFPQYQQIVSPIEKYQAGDIDKCKASIYIGSYFDNKIPAAFLKDYAATSKNIAWLGYNVWQLGSGFESLFGYRYSHLTTLDTTHKDAKGYPTYFKDILYKGEVFSKFGDWDKANPTQFLAPFEQSVLVPLDLDTSELVAQARHNFTGEVIPYILRAKNHFYVADVPFSYIHEGDRYLVFADLLFDILNEKPRHTEKYAFLRVEDVHPLTPLSYNYDIIHVLQAEQVPVNISLIPIFADPLNLYDRKPNESFVPMNRKPAFMQMINEIKAQGANFIWHGVTHQYETHKNPYNAVSADDFEFWDATQNKAIAEDSVDYVLNKLNDGWYTLQQSGLTPHMWLTPHYQASALDYQIFARIFPWNVGRVIYFNQYTSGFKSVAAEKDLWLESNNPQGDRLRREALGGLQIRYQSDRWSGQFFPYEIFGDVYGQRLIPENLGNSQPYISEYVVRPRSVQDIVADAKRNRVLRDAWASLFYHPYLLAPYRDDGRGAYPGDPSELRYIITQLKGLGYRFIDINQFLNKNTITKRPEPIYKELEL